LGATNSVAWTFERKGLFAVATSKVNEERLMEITAEVGAVDWLLVGNAYHVTCPVDAFPA
jgi:transcriptional/translational regulatory protein YebC/TACO1